MLGVRGQGLGLGFAGGLRSACERHRVVALPVGALHLIRVRVRVMARVRVRVRVRVRAKARVRVRAKARVRLGSGCRVRVPRWPRAPRH